MSFPMLDLNLFYLVNVNLNTLKAPGWCPLADFANEVKATYKEKEEERMHHIS